jgi:hypothetical protein
MAKYIVPSIGVQGVFKLAAPFDTSIIASGSYTVIAVRLLADKIASGDNPFTDIYEPKGVSQEKYQQDTLDGVAIISLQASDGSVILIPNSYVISYPSVGGVPYTVVLLGVNLGAIPDSLDVTLLMSQIQELVLAKMGIEADVAKTVASNTEMIDSATSSNMEIVRISRITDNTTEYSKYLAEKKRADALQAQLDVLNQYIISKSL